MSYNITSFKVKRLWLELPMTFDFQAWLISQPESPSKRWCKDSFVQANLAKQTWELDLDRIASLSGSIENGVFLTNAINNLREDGSGRLYHEILLPLFQTFRGDLQAIVVWANGDTVTDLCIENGRVHETNIA